MFEDKISDSLRAMEFKQVSNLEVQYKSPTEFILPVDA
jgi:hypothetical protein